VLSRTKFKAAALMLRTNIDLVDQLVAHGPRVPGEPPGPFSTTLINFRSTVSHDHRHRDEGQHAEVRHRGPVVIPVPLGVAGARAREMIEPPVPIAQLLEPRRHFGHEGVGFQ
jgi:hypothetical protein